MIVVLASRNTKKLAEMRAILAPLNWELPLVSEFSDIEPEESALSFVENSLIKARYAAQVSGLPAIADDSGLEVPALRGAPGVRSARYAGLHGDDGANNRKLITDMQTLEGAQREARFVSVLSFLRHAEDPVPVIAQGFWPGRILAAPQGDGGFGYDPLFFVETQACTAAQLSQQVKNAISHRAQAARQLLNALSEVRLS